MIAEWLALCEPKAGSAFGYGYKKVGAQLLIRIIYG